MNESIAQALSEEIELSHRAANAQTFAAGVIASALLHHAASIKADLSVAAGIAATVAQQSAQQIADDFDLTMMVPPGFDATQIEPKNRVAIFEQYLVNSIGPTVKALVANRKLFDGVAK